MIYHKERPHDEWVKLIKSGKIWENYFRPFEWRKEDDGINLINFFILFLF
jgi:hypothetical protein